MKCFWVFCDWPSCDHSCCYQASSSNGCSCQLLHVCVSVCTFFSLIYLFFVLFLVFGCCFLCWLVSELFGLTVIWCNVRCDYHACVTEYSTMLHFSLCDWKQHYVPFLVVWLNTALCSISRCVTEHSTMFHFSLCDWIQHYVPFLVETSRQDSCTALWRQRHYPTYGFADFVWIV